MDDGFFMGYSQISYVQIANRALVSCWPFRISVVGYIEWLVSMSVLISPKRIKYDAKRTLTVPAMEYAGGVEVSVY